MINDECGDVQLDELYKIYTKRVEYGFTAVHH